MLIEISSAAQGINLKLAGQLGDAGQCGAEISPPLAGCIRACPSKMSIEVQVGEQEQLHSLTPPNLESPRSLRYQCGSGPRAETLDSPRGTPYGRCALRH